MRAYFRCVSALAAALAFSAFAPALQAQVATHFTLPAQSLADALRAVGIQTNTSVVFDPALVEGRSAPALDAQISLDEALSRLLVGSGLTHQFLNERTVVLASSKGAHAETTSSAGGNQPSQTGVMRLAQADSPNNSKTSGPGTTEGSSSNASSQAASSAEESGNKLEEIIVTAEKREESIQDLPIAISAFSGEALADRGIDGIQGLQQIASSLQVNFSPGGNTDLAMRGVSTGKGNLGGEPGVATTRDGVPYAAQHLTTGLGDFFDIERVEVLRGPQGTISGRNATAGAVHFHSKRPTEELEGSVKATVGNFDRLAVEGHLSGPLIADRLLGRVAVRSDQADGWVTNTFLGEELGTVDQVQARASLLANLTDDLEAHLILEAFRDRSDYLSGGSVARPGQARPDMPSGLDVLGVPGFDPQRRTVSMDMPTNFEAEKYEVVLGLNWDLGPSARLTATTGYVDLFQDQTFDNDGTAAPLIRFALEDGILFDTWQLSQEVTLTADLTDRLDVIVGGLFLQLDQERFIDNDIPLIGLPSGTFPLLANQTLTSWGGYTSWRYRLNDAIRLSAGVRYTHDSKNYKDRSSIFGAPLFADEDKSWSEWTPRFAVDYTPTDDLTLYASASRGFKSGGFDTFSHLGGALTSFEPEFIWNYEAGVKATLADGRLKTALTGFYMDYTDLQQASFTFVEGAVITLTSNAKEATIVGAELEFDALVTDRFQFNFGATWLEDATYGELLLSNPLFPELGVQDFEGKRMVRAPEWQFNASGEYRVPLPSAFLGGDLQGMLRVTYAWQDTTHYDLFNNEGATQGAYGLLDLLAAIETNDGRWRLSAYAHNLSDESYFWDKNIGSGFLTALVGLAAGAPGAPVLNGRPGEPRRYGVSLAYRF